MRPATTKLFFASLYEGWMSRALGVHALVRLLGAMLLVVFVNITCPEWKRRIARTAIILISIASWIPAGLAIALPGIFSHLRHQA
jgi:hypothetical protein